VGKQSHRGRQRRVILDGQQFKYWR